MALDLMALMRDLSQLREYRARRAANRSPWWVRIPYFRNVVRHRALDGWPGGYVVRTDGRMVYVPAHVDVAAGHRLFKPATPIGLIDPLCRPGDWILDIGANVGEYTLAMALRVGHEGKVIAFEPVPYLAETVAKTARINRHDWVEVHQLALSASDGTAEFSVERGSSGGSRLGRVNGGFSHITVQMSRLDSFVSARAGIQRIDFVKIDVEGFEEHVLRGARETLARFRPALLIESGFESPEQRRSICELLNELGYDLTGAAVPGGLIEISWANYRDNEEILSTLGVCNLLLLPR